MKKQNINNKLKVRKGLISLAIGLSIVFSSLFGFLLPVLRTYSYDYGLKTSAGEITINSPSDGMITEQSSGYYPATYGFENESAGVFPGDWGFGGYGTLKVVNVASDHAKVVELNDWRTDNCPILYNKFSPQEFGTVELWVMSDDVSKLADINLLVPEPTNYGGINSLGAVALDNNIVRYADGAWWDTDMVVYDNTWYHIRIDFECTSGGYMGLSNHKWRFFVNGEQYGDFDIPAAIEKAGNLNFYTHTGDKDYRIYLDAVGYSWDPNYEIGANRQKGLLLDIETDPSISFDSLEYTIDSADPVQITGDTAIPMPVGGSHALQVHGVSSGGADYYSDIRTFSIDKYIKILSPSGGTIAEPSSGYYPATYGFENDPLGSDPDGWMLDEAGGDIKVVEEISGHKKVLELLDTSDGDEYQGGIITATQVFGQKTEGTIELWICPEQTSATLDIIIYSGGNTHIHFYFRNDGYVGWYDSATGHHAVFPYQANEWGHVRISFTTSSWKSWFNGVLVADNAKFENVGTPTAFDRLMLRTWGKVKCTYYLDAVGYSWDPHYNPTGDELPGSNPAEWVLDESGGSIDIIPEMGDHDDILQLQDISNSEFITATYMFGFRYEGTIGLWVLPEQRDDTLDIIVYSGGNTHIHFYFRNDGYVGWYDSATGHHAVLPYQANEWSFVRIHFTMNSWSAWFNGAPVVKEAGFEGGAPPYFDRLMLRTWGPPAVCTFFVDPVGYSWDLNYEMRSNLYEGLLVDIESTVTIGSLEYSLNGGLRVPIIGDFVLPLPESGDHELQVFGTTADGVVYQSDTSRFSLYLFTNADSERNLPAPVSEFAKDPCTGNSYAQSVNDWGYEDWWKRADGRFRMTIAEAYDSLYTSDYHVFDSRQEHYEGLDVMDIQINLRIICNPHPWIRAWSLNIWNEYYQRYDLIPIYTRANIWSDYFISAPYLEDEDLSHYMAADGTIKLRIMTTTDSNLFEKSYVTTKIDVLTVEVIYESPNPILVYCPGSDKTYYDGYLSEGLPIAYEVAPGLQLENLDYSLDGEARQALPLNNKIAGYNGLGDHEIQLFGIDSEGEECSSEIISFTVDSGFMETTLIGSTDRYFPQLLEQVQLGFTFTSLDTIADHVDRAPQIRFIINDTISTRHELVTLKLYVDKEEVWTNEEPIDIAGPTEATEFVIDNIERLSEYYLTHQVVLTISSGIDYKLECLIINHIDCTEEYLMEDGYYHAPVQLYGFESNQNNAFVSMSSLAPRGTQDGALVMEPVLLVQLDDRSTEDYYIHSTTMEFRFIDPDGELYESSQLNFGPIKTSYTGIGEKVNLITDMIEILQFCISAGKLVGSLFSLGSLYSAGLLIASMGLDYLGPSYSGTIERITETSPGVHESYWQMDYMTTVGVGTYPGDEDLVQFGTSTRISDIFSATTKQGSYQAQISWSVDIYEHYWQEVTWYDPEGNPVTTYFCGCELSSTIEGIYYLNYEI